MHNPIYAHIATIPNAPKEDPYPSPQVIALVEDLPTLSHLAADRMGRYTYDEQSNILSTEPVPTKEKDEPDYTKLPTRDDFAIPEIDPLNTTRFWALIAYGDEKHVIRIEYPTDPLQGVVQTKEHFTLEGTVVGDAARYVTQGVAEGAVPSAEPDAHDDWACRLFKGLYSESV